MFQKFFRKKIRKETAQAAGFLAYLRKKSLKKTAFSFKRAYIAIAFIAAL